MLIICYAKVEYSAAAFFFKVTLRISPLLNVCPIAFDSSCASLLLVVALYVSSIKKRLSAVNLLFHVGVNYGFCVLQQSTIALAPSRAVSAVKDLNIAQKLKDMKLPDMSYFNSRLHLG